jgi:hypothetical protein
MGGEPAKDHAGVVSCDWYGLAAALSEVLSRGNSSAG